jgi:hypothetical protein
LFEIQIERERAGEMERESGGIGGGEILGGASDRQEFRVQLNCAGGVFPRRCSGFVVDHENFGLEEGTLLVNAKEFETLAAFGDEVEAAVGIFFDDGDDFGGASHLGEALLEGAHDAEGELPGEAFANHFFIARFEDVQGQWSTGE